MGIISEADYKIGQETLNKLFNLELDKLREVIKDITEDNDSHLLEKGDVKKVSINDEPESITISYYDSIYIDASGIWYRPEHGCGTNIVKFNKYFNLVL